MDPSKKRSFNDQWKKAFDEASVTPPASAWESIEARLDQDEIKRTFEDQWGKTFSDAAITPPPSVWEGIEARLDEEEDVAIIPIWWQSPKLWYAAASIAALLIVGGLWLKNGVTENGRSSDIAAKITLPMKPEPVTAELSAGKINKTREVNHAETSKNVTGRSITSIKSGRGKIDNSVKAEHTDVVDDQNKSLATLEPLKPNSKLGKETRELIAARDKNTEPGKQVAANEKATGDQKVLFNSKSKSDLAVSIEEIAQKEELIRSAISAEMLASLPYKNLNVYFQKRYVFYKDNETQSVVPAKKHQEYWAGLGLMPASFNPDVNLKSSPASFANKSFASQKALTGKNDPGFSYAVQTQGGMRISKHWSVETGITYLQGNSQYEGGGYLLDAATYGSSNVLENAYADLTNKSTGLSNNSIYIDVSKQVRNDYQYLQLPVQAGFTLNPDGKLSYSVLGGMMANFFLNNELQSDNGDVIKTTASDDVYRGMNWAATTGLRFNYKLSSKWRATLTGSYQKAVTSGFRANQSLESHPSLYGVAWGMRYSF